MKYLSHILTAALASTLSACGGGSGSASGGPASPPPAAVNAVPTISVVEKTSISQDAVTEPIAFTVSDPESAASVLTLAVESSNAELIPSDAIRLSGNGESRAVVLAPSDGMAGTSTITLMATDAQGASAKQSFDVTVTSEQRSFQEMVGTAMGNEAETSGEQIVGFSWVDNPEEDDTAFDHMFTE
jgi:hypothetical protein